MIILMKLVNNKKPAGALHHLRHSLQGGEGAGLQLGEDLKTFRMKFPAKMISKRPPEHLQRKPQRLLVAEIEQSGSEEVLRIFWTFSMIFQTFWIFWQFWTFWIFWTFSTNWKNVFLNLFPFGEGEPALKPLDRDLICFRAWFPPTLSLVVLVLSRHCGQHPGLLLLPSHSLPPPSYLVWGKASIISFFPLPMLPFPIYLSFEAAQEQATRVRTDWTIRRKSLLLSLYKSPSSPHGFQLCLLVSLNFCTTTTRETKRPHF